MNFLNKLFSKKQSTELNDDIPSKKSRGYKCPKCGAALKNAGDLEIKKLIELFSALDPEMLKDVEVQCWKCGNRITAADLI